MSSALGHSFLAFLRSEPDTDPFLSLFLPLINDLSDSASDEWTDAEDVDFDDMTATIQYTYAYEINQAPRSCAFNNERNLTK